ncbi:neutral zinc metallopeptidase [Silicimonas sp. MF1-12-2]|uniref:KPN_02809 family neutral zinc metallopeptidase n=1 Tax=Silicimonas sp. MF1-12-2 TaxID=3384793 RepID=UPI0039B4F366
MKWQGRRGSRNIEDRRGRTMTGGGSIGLVGLLIILGLGYFFGIDVTPLLQGGVGGGQVVETELTEADRRAGEFVSVTLADTEEVWDDIFRRQVGETYNPPTLVLYKGVTQSPCGGASGATGPFYCPGDKKVYLDTGFFTTLERRMGAGGDFAAAYVVAHEVAHHVQDELGILGQANRVRAQSSEADSNAISVRIELQADCYSGVWARAVQSKFGTLERGDIAEAMNAAKQIGDDTLQRNSGRIPQPHTFTHGTSEQRQRWFATGYETGDIRACDTFGARQL